MRLQNLSSFSDSKESAMIGCMRTRVRKQPIIALYFESETVLKLYNLEASNSAMFIIAFLLKKKNKSPYWHLLLKLGNPLSKNKIFNWYIETHASVKETKSTTMNIFRFFYFLFKSFVKWN